MSIISSTAARLPMIVQWTSTVIAIFIGYCPKINNRRAQEKSIFLTCLLFRILATLVLGFIVQSLDLRNTTIGHFCLTSYLLVGMTEISDYNWTIFSQFWKKFLLSLCLKIIKKWKLIIRIIAMYIIIDLKIELFPRGDKKSGKCSTIGQTVNAL